MNTTLKIFTRFKAHQLALLLIGVLVIFSHSTELLAQTAPQRGWQSVNLTADVDLVVGAIATQIRAKSLSRKAKKEIDFVDGLAELLHEQRFHYAGFTLTSVAIDEYHTSDKDPDFRWISAMLRFHDRHDRVVSTAIRSEYRMVGKKIIIESAVILPLSSHNPRVNLYYVLANKLPKSLYQKQTSQEALLKLVKENAIPLNQKELISREGQDYVAFAFVMDRLVTDASVELRESKYQNNLKGNLSKNKTLSFDGWFVAITEGTFSHKNPKKRFHKVIYTPGWDVPIKKQVPRLIGVFVTP